MYTMKQTCEQVGMSYEALKFYCNQGLVPNVKRDKNNRRIFSDKDIAWIKGLICLRNCGMSIENMKAYLALCLQGKSSIPQRKKMLEAQKTMLLTKKEEMQRSLDYIEQKQRFYDDVQAGKIAYFSNLIQVDDSEEEQ